MLMNLLSTLSPFDIQNEDKKLDLIWIELEDLLDHGFSMSYLFSQRTEQANRHDMETQVTENDPCAIGYQCLKNCLKWHNDKCKVFDILLKYSTNNGNLDEAFCCYLWHFFAGQTCLDSQTALISAFSIKGYQQHAFHLLEKLTQSEEEEDLTFSQWCNAIESKILSIQSQSNVLNLQVCMNLISSLFSSAAGSIPSKCCFVFRCIQEISSNETLTDLEAKKTIYSIFINVSEIPAMSMVFETRSLDKLDLYQLCMLKQWLKLLTDDHNESFFPMALAVFHKCPAFRQFFFDFGESLCSQTVLWNLAKHDGHCPAVYCCFHEYISFFIVICSQIVNGCDIDLLQLILSPTELNDLQELTLSDCFNDSILSNPVFIAKFMSMRSLDLFGCGTMPDGSFFINKLSQLPSEEMGTFLSIFLFVVFVELPPTNVIHEPQTRENVCLRQPVLYHAFNRACCDGPLDSDRNVFPFYDQHFISSFSTLFFTVIVNSNLVAENCRKQNSSWILLVKKLKQFMTCKQDLQVLSTIYLYLETLTTLIKSDGDLPVLIVSDFFIEKFLKTLLNLHKPPVNCAKLCKISKTVIKKVNSVIFDFLSLKDIVIPIAMAFLIFEAICNSNCCDSYTLRLFVLIIEKHPKVIGNDLLVYKSFCTTLLKKMNFQIKKGIDLKDADEIISTLNLFRRLHLFTKESSPDCYFTTIDQEEIEHLILNLANLINGNVKVSSNSHSDESNLKVCSVLRVSAGILFADLIHNTSYHICDTSLVNNFRQLLVSIEKY